MHDSETGNLLAVGSRTQESADKFGDEHGIERRYGSYQDLLEDRDVEAVYIAPLHPFHSEWAIKAAEAGKHILWRETADADLPNARWKSSTPPSGTTSS